MNKIDENKISLVKTIINILKMTRGVTKLKYRIGNKSIIHSVQDWNNSKKYFLTGERL